MQSPTERRRVASLPLPAKVLRELHRRGVRGQTRFTFLLANRLESLQAVPITIAGCPPLYVDLRQGSTHELLRGTPWASDPWDREERMVMRGVIRPGDVAFDIGANIGVHTVLISALIGPSGRVFAFEPNSDLAPALRRTVDPLPNADAFVIALSDENREATLFVPEFNLMASLANWTKPQHAAGEVRSVACAMRRLDDLVEAGTIPLPDFVKCDVEGAELKVFRGARSVLDRVGAPVVLFEVNAGAAAGFGQGVADAKEFLSELSAPGYHFLSIEADGRLADVPVPLPAFGNLLAVPVARLDRISGYVADGQARSS